MKMLWSVLVIRHALLQVSETIFTKMVPLPSSVSILIYSILIDADESLQRIVVFICSYAPLNNVVGLSFMILKEQRLLQ